MPMQRGKSGFMAKYGDKVRKAYAKHSEEEVIADIGGGLPPGIDLGVAQLVDCKIGQFKAGNNKGEYFYYAAGVVKSPSEVNGVPIVGERTQVGPEPLCDTPKSQGKRKTFDDHYAYVLNEFKKLGIDVSEFDDGDLEGMAAALKEAEPHFRFRTWQGTKTKEFPNPRVQHVWKGLCEFDGEAVDEVVDETEETEEEEESEAETAPWDADELDELAKAADEESDTDAQEKLQTIAEGLDINPEELDDWAAVVEAIKGAGGEEEKEEEEYTPSKKDVVYYKPPKAKKRIECDVVAVFKPKKLVNLKNLDDGKTVYKNVSWDDLETE